MASFESSKLSRTPTTTKSTCLATTVELKPNLPYVSPATDPLAIINPTQNDSYMLVIPAMLPVGYVRHPNSTNLNMNPRLPLTIMTQPTSANSSLKVIPAKIQTNPQNILAPQVLPTVNFCSTSGTSSTVTTLTSNGLVMGGCPIVSLTSTVCAQTKTVPQRQYPITSTTQEVITLVPHHKPFLAVNSRNVVLHEGPLALPHIRPMNSKRPTVTNSVNSNKPPEYKNPFDYSFYKAAAVVHDLDTKIGAKSNEKSDPSPQLSEWACMICFEVHQNKESLLAHYDFHKEEKDKLAAKNSNTNLFECPVCFKQFNLLNTFNQHVLDVHGEKEFFCTNCNRSYRGAYALSIHNSEKHSPDPNVYNCCICKTYQTKLSQKLRQHIKSTHSKGVVYKCEICEKTFTSLTWLNNHKIFHTDGAAYECKICKKGFTHRRLLVNHNQKYHVNVSETTKYECQSCNLNFPNIKAFLRHSRSHGMESSLCFICGKVFGNDKKLRMHLKLHSETKKFICNVCGRSFHKNNTLVSHLRTHSGEKPYKCITCGKCFSQRTPLVIHLRHHTGEKPYVCPTCNKGYVSRSALTIHRKTC